MFDIEKFCTPLAISISGKWLLLRKFQHTNMQSRLVPLLQFQNPMYIRVSMRAAKVAI